ncbi:hypothetical protein Tco_0236553 [Tanacetum coccineum]
MVPNPDRLLERYIKGLPLNIKGNVTSSKPVDLHEAIEMAQGLMYQVVQELGENSGDKRKWNGNHYNPNNTNNTSNQPEQTPKDSKGVYSQERHGIRPKTAELYLVPQAKEDPEAKETRENNQRQNQGNPKGNSQASTALKEDAKHLAEYTAYVMKLR